MVYALSVGDDFADYHAFGNADFAVYPPLSTASALLRNALLYCDAIASLLSYRHRRYFIFRRNISFAQQISFARRANFIVTVPKGAMTRLCLSRDHKSRGFLGWR